MFPDPLGPNTNKQYIYLNHDLFEVDRTAFQEMIRNACLTTEAGEAVTDWVTVTEWVAAHGRLLKEGEEPHD